MPIYEYQCPKCRHEFEELVFEDVAPVCPQCYAANAEKKVSRPCAVRSGSRADFSVPAGSGGGCASCSGGSCASCGH
jgi:putative FmdB family regulatory protein